MNKNNIWLITAKTNLHVGNENTSSYGLIDKAIQRDALTNLPCINSSSLKGALNEYAAQIAKMDSKDLIKIFGCDKVKEEDENKKLKNRNSNTQKGNYIFFDAQILFLPVQDDNDLYKLVTCQNVIKAFNDKVTMLSGDNAKFEQKYPNLMTIDDAAFDKGQLSTDKHFIVSNKKFAELCSDDNLPIIARNVLENGESKNLWYEQVLPAETVLYTFIDDTKSPVKNEKGEEILAKVLTSSNAIVQIGANATIGYGYCKFNNLK